MRLAGGLHGLALNSQEDLQFRNLGGEARQHMSLGRNSGTLTTEVRATKITSAAGMILQSYEFAVRSAEGPVYAGSADFGFFPPRAMTDQVGIKSAGVYRMSEAEWKRAQAIEFPDQPPFPEGRWRMIDRVDEMIPDGGPHEPGFDPRQHRSRRVCMVLRGSFHERPGLARVAGA